MEEEVMEEEVMEEEMNKKMINLSCKRDAKFGDIGNVRETY